jgi:hypothetical protein
MYEQYLSEMGQSKTTGQSTAKPSTFKPVPGAGSAGGSGSGGRRGTPGASPGRLRVTSPAANAPRKLPSEVTGVVDPKWDKPGTPVKRPASPTPAARPAAAAPKAAPAPKPATAKSAPTGTPMQQWAKANPKLAAASAERERTRGTSSTTNPLMKDMKSSLPAPKSPSPSTTQVAFSKSTPSLATTPTKAIAAAPSTSPAASGSVAPATAKIASAPKPASLAPATGSKKPGSTFEQYDAYDIVLEYLLSQGHAETLEEALYVMMEMDSEMIQDIVEGSYEDRIAANNKKYDSARKRAAQRAQARNAARDAGQTGAVKGVGYVTPRREKTTYRDSAGTERHNSGAKAK